MFDFFRRTKQKPLPVVLATELPDDYAMLLHMLELGSVSIEVTHISLTDVHVLFSVERGGETTQLGTHRLASGDVLRLNDVHVLPRHRIGLTRE